MKDLYYRSIVFFELYEEMELICKLKESGDTISLPDLSSGKKNKRLILPPIKYMKNKTEKYFTYIPFLSINFNFKKNIPVGNSISLDLYKEENKIFSIRFDQRSKGSNHDFFHVQINSDIEGYVQEGSCNKTICWFPSKIPIIPVVDNNKVSALNILFFILGTLYGFKIINDIFLGCAINPSIYSIKSLNDFYKLSIKTAE